MAHSIDNPDQISGEAWKDSNQSGLLLTILSWAPQTEEKLGTPHLHR